MRLHLISFLVVLSVIALGPAQAQQEASVVVEGTLMIGEFIGPPNYGENPKTDKIERSYFLQLPAPLPTQMAKKGVKEVQGFDLGEASDRDHFVQLVVLDKNKDMAKFIGKKVRVSGLVFRAETGHHRTGTLVQVTSISGIKSWHW